MARMVCNLSSAPRMSFPLIYTLLPVSKPIFGDLFYLDVHTLTIYLYIHIFFPLFQSLHLSGNRPLKQGVMCVALAVLAVLIQACLISATDVCAQQSKSDPTPNCNAIHLPGLHDIVPGGKPYTIRWDVSTFVLLTA